MAFPTDYTFVLTDPSISIAVNTNAPIIEGNAQLGFSSPNAGPQTGSIYRTDPLERGYVRGVFRAFIRPNGQSGVTCLGWVFLQNQLDVVSNTNGGQCYFAFLKGEFGSQKISIVKIADGINGVDLKFAPTLINANFTVANGQFLPIEVEWNANPAVSGVELSLWRGNIAQADFDNLTLIGTATDTTNPLMTSVAEGPACSFSAAQASAYDMDLLGFDELVED